MILELNYQTEFLEMEESTPFENLFAQLTFDNAPLDSADARKLAEETLVNVNPARYRGQSDVLEAAVDKLLAEYEDSRWGR